MLVYHLNALIHPLTAGPQTRHPDCEGQVQVRVVPVLVAGQARHIPHLWNFFPSSKECQKESPLSACRGPERGTNRAFFVLAKEVRVDEPAEKTNHAVQSED
eukprot:3941134-Rhodomonas_salina.4